MNNPIEEAIRVAGSSIEHLVRVIIRAELREHLGPEADHLLNVKNAPMSANKLRSLVRTGKLRGYRHGKDTFVSASEFRAFIQGHPVEPAKPIAVPDVDADAVHDVSDEIAIEFGVVPSDPDERRAFEARLMRRREGGGERAKRLQEVEYAAIVKQARDRPVRRKRRT